MNIADLPPSTDPFAEADEDTGETKQSQNYIHIRIQREFRVSSLTSSTLRGEVEPGCANPAGNATFKDKRADSNLITTERNGRKTLTTVQGLPKKFDQKKILKVIKKKFGMLSLSSSRFHIITRGMSS